MSQQVEVRSKRQNSHENISSLRISGKAYVLILLHLKICYIFGILENQKHRDLLKQEHFFLVKTWLKMEGYIYMWEISTLKDVVTNQTKSLLTSQRPLVIPTSNKG